MKKFKTWFIWIYVNICGTYIMYNAVMENDTTLANIFIFLTHVLFVINVITFIALVINQDRQEEFLKKDRVPYQLELGYDLTASIFLAANGWFYYATLWLIIGILVATISQPTKTKCSCGSGRLYKDCCFGKPIDKSKLYRYTK